MSETWKYLISDYFTSRWANTGTNVYLVDMSEPRIGIYCPHETGSFLFGTFEVSPVNLEQKNQIYWGFWSHYVDANGIKFGLRDRFARTQEIIDDAPFSFEQNKRDTLAAIESGDDALIERAAHQADRYFADLRTRISFKCRVCGDRFVVRSDKINEPLSTAWRGGIRELTLSQLRRIV